MKKIIKSASVAALLGTTLLTPSVSADDHTLYRQPSISKKHIVFAYAGDIWRVDRKGGAAIRITTGLGTESNPFISPDGKKVAFTGDYDGNSDVFVVDINGGVPQRMTWHPGPDLVRGWNVEGDAVLFSSRRDSFANFQRLYTKEIEGNDLPEMLPLPSAERGSFSKKGTHIAYEPLNQWQEAFKRYQGGQQDKIWIADLADSSVTEIPKGNNSDRYPAYVGDKVYFISDRDTPNFDYRLYSYDTKSAKVTLEYGKNTRDLKWLSAAPDGMLVMEEFGKILTFDPKKGRAKEVKITANADIAAMRERYKPVGTLIANADLSPSGKRAVFEARGEIMTVPVKDGDIRQITGTPGVMERGPKWSPDGQSIAYFSDKTGDYALHIRDQKGEEAERIIKLPPQSYSDITWSPDSEKIAFTDHGLVIWYVDVLADEPTPVRVDKNLYPSSTDITPNWAPNSDWLTYTKVGRNQLHSVYLYELATATSTQITDGMSDAQSPLFDDNGKYLYFTASTNIGETISWADMSGLGRTTTSSLYAIVLDGEAKSPLAPKSDDEPKKEKPKKKEPKADQSEDEKPAIEDKKAEAEAEKPASEDKAEKPKKPSTKITLDGIQSRIVALPAPATNYVDLMPAGKGSFLAAEYIPPLQGPPSLNIWQWDGKARKFAKKTGGIGALIVGQDRKSALVRRGRASWSVDSLKALGKPGKRLNTAAMKARVKPSDEWAQMFEEVWRGQRDYFYDANLHGMDLKWLEETYRPYVQNIRHRSDLTHLFVEMVGQLTIGHMYVSGGDEARADRVPGGLLGADYALVDGRYQIKTIYNGEHWSPNLRGPLSEPGLNISAGDFIIAVNGQDLTADQNIFAHFEATANKQVRLKIAKSADGSDAREVIVRPVASDAALRRIDWVEGNRRKVDALSGGRLAYVYMPNTAGPGFNSFNRYFYAQTDKEGAVLDERFNGGGLLADYVVQTFKKDWLANIYFRYGDMTVPVPGGAIYGPKAMIINERAGSGGDAMPWFFKKAGVGKLFGMKTWGGLVAAQGLPRLMDGGSVRSPDAAIFGTEGEWEVENHGVAPDVMVDWDPALWRQGRDPQLEATVKHLMDELGKSGGRPNKEQVPAMPDYSTK